MSQAAVSLQVTQPTLTRNIKSIEEIIGAPVLLRGRYGVTPTNIGERLAEHGRAILNSMSEADNAVQHWKTGLVGEIRLGVGPLLSATLLPAFLGEHPMDESNFTLKVVATSTPSLLQGLRKGDIDMAIMSANNQQTHQTLVQTRLFSDDVCILAGSASPLNRIKGPVNTRLLAGQPWLSINQMARIRHIHDEVPEQLGIDGVVPKFAFEGDVSAPMEFMRDSNLLSVLPRIMAEKYVSESGMKILAIDVVLPKRDVALWVSKEKQNESSVQEMKRKIISHFCQYDVDKPAANTVEIKSMYAHPQLTN